MQTYMEKSATKTNQHNRLNTIKETQQTLRIVQERTTTYFELPKKERRNTFSCEGENNQIRRTALGRTTK